MGMYLTAYKKVGEGKFEHDYRWPNDKWAGRGELWETMQGVGVWREGEYARPLDFEKLRGVLQRIYPEVLGHEALTNLIDLMEKDEKVFVQYE